MAAKIIARWDLQSCDVMRECAIVANPLPASGLGEISSEHHDERAVGFTGVSESPCFVIMFLCWKHQELLVSMSGETSACREMTGIHPGQSERQDAPFSPFSP